MLIILILILEYWAWKWWKKRQKKKRQLAFRDALFKATEPFMSWLLHDSMFPGELLFMGPDKEWRDLHVEHAKRKMTELHEFYSGKRREYVPEGRLPYWRDEMSDEQHARMERERRVTWTR